MNAIREIKYAGIVPTHKVMASELRRVSAIEFRIFFQDNPDAVIALHERTQVVAYIASPQRLSHLSDINGE